MDELLGARIELNPRPPAPRAPVLVAAMLGHCPGRFRADRLTARALAALRTAGYARSAERLLAEPERADAWHLPIPLAAAAELDDLFPDARGTPTRYRSVLAGDRAWLPDAVDDFFAQGGERLWVVRVPEADGQRGFLSLPGRGLNEPEALQGLATVLAVAEVGVVAMPDLERLQIPAELPDVPRVRLENPQPRFLPCGGERGDTHRERRHADEMPDAPAPWPTGTLLRAVLRDLDRYRPDIQWLFTLPPGYASAAGRPVLDPAARQAVEALRGERDAAQLRRVTLLFPYLRSHRRRLSSPTGAVAGAQAAVAQQAGPWRSMAGRPLRSEARPYPAVSRQDVVAWRDTPGIGVLEHRRGALTLDDERLTVPALPAADYPRSAVAATDSPLAGYRSGEVMRLLGHLIRELRALGESLIFDVDPRDPRPRMALERYFRRLHAAGALRGRRPEQAFRVTQRTAPPAELHYDIEIAPAFPVDRIRLTFANRDGAWQPELRHD